MGLQQVPLEWFLVNMACLKTNSRVGKNTPSFVACFSSASEGVLEMNIGQISYETDQLLIIQIWGLQTKSRCYMDTVQIKLKPGDLIKREV